MRTAASVSNRKVFCPAGQYFQAKSGRVSIAPPDYSAYVMASSAGRSDLLRGAGVAVDASTVFEAAVSARLTAAVSAAVAAIVSAAISAALAADLHKARRSTTAMTACRNSTRIQTHPISNKESKPCVAALDAALIVSSTRRMMGFLCMSPQSKWRGWSGIHSDACGAASPTPIRRNIQPIRRVAPWDIHPVLRGSFSDAEHTKDPGLEARASGVHISPAFRRSYPMCASVVAAPERSSNGRSLRARAGPAKTASQPAIAT